MSDSDIAVQDPHTKIPSALTGGPGPIVPVPQNTGLEQVLKQPTSALSELGRFLRPNPGTSKREESPPPYPAMPGSVSLPGPSRRLARSSQPGSQPSPIVTPLSNIGMFCKYDTLGNHLMPHPQLANNIDMAIRACAPERNNLLRNREEMQIVKESLDEGYCDVSGRAGDLDFVGMCFSVLCDSLVRLQPSNIGSMGGVKVFAAEGTIFSLTSATKHRPLVSTDLPERDTLIQRKRDALARFIHVLNPLVAVYKIPPSSLHIFADPEGQLVAFNRGGSLFMNLRYYEAWRTSRVASPLQPSFLVVPFRRL
jgi:hypothetical protein